MHYFFVKPEPSKGKEEGLIHLTLLKSKLIDLIVLATHEKERQMNNRKEIIVRYKIALYRSDEGYSVSIPGLPGCWSEGRTEEEALANIEVAIREYLSVVEDLLEDAEVREIELAV